MVEHETALATNRAGWNRVAKYFHGSTALPEYGPLAPTEDTLKLLDGTSDLCVLEFGCGSRHSLRYLAERGARELWGLDLSSTQIAFAEETLRPFASRVRLIESPLEVSEPLRPRILHLWAWVHDGPTKDHGTRQRISAARRKLNRERRAPRLWMSRMERDTVHRRQILLYRSPHEHASWKGVPIVIHDRTLATFVGGLVHAGLRLEALVETPVPGRWYSIAREQTVPTTFIIKARKPPQS